MSGVTKAIGGLFNPKMPKISTPKMPDLGGFQQKLAARTQAAEERKKRKGRQETIKTAGSNYSGANLGGTA